MGIELYYNPLSPPSLSVVLLSRALELPLDLKEIDIMGKEQYSEDFMKMNPQHTIPFLVDEEFSLSESGAIMIYLVEAYGNGDYLYPKDHKQRAIINQRIMFDVGTLWMRVFQCYFLPVFHQNMGINDLIIERVNDAFTTLDAFLDGKEWAAGDEITVADFCLITTVAASEAVGYEVSKYENVSEWFKRCKEAMVDYGELIQTPMDTLNEYFMAKLSKLDS